MDALQGHSQPYIAKYPNALDACNLFQGVADTIAYTFNWETQIWHSNKKNTYCPCRSAYEGTAR